MKYAAGRLRLKLPFLLVSFLSLASCVCGLVRLEKASLVAPRDERVARCGGWRLASQNFDRLEWSAAGSHVESFLWSKSERDACTRLTSSPAYRVGNGAAKGWTRDASFKRCSSTCVRDAPGAYVPLTGRYHGAALFSNAAATNANASVLSAPGLLDTALPPQSNSAPLIDLSFCRADFVSGASNVSAQGATPFWQPHGSGGLVKTVPSEGPVTFFDSRTDLHPSLTGASDDAFFIDFYGPLHWGAAEIAQTCLAAAKRFIRARELKCRHSHLARQLVEQPTLKEPETYGSNLQSQSAGVHSKAVPKCTGLLGGSADLSTMLAQKRFGTPPYWLVERVAYALRRLRPSSFGFLVAQMLEALCRILEAERKLGTTIDNFASNRMQTYLRNVWHMSPAEYAIHMTNGNPRTFNDVLKFRRGFPVFPWGLSMDPQVTRSFMEHQLQVNEDTLTQHFFAARRASGAAWTSAARYRTTLEEIPREKRTQRLYEGCNSAAIACIKHVAAGWQRPVYVLSTLERARSLRRLLAALGLPRGALQHIHICGADGILLGTDPDHRRPREVSLDLSGTSSSDACGDVTGNKAVANAFPSMRAASALGSSCALDDATGTQPDGPATDSLPQEANHFAPKLAGALALWQYHVRMGFRGVPHFVDDDIQSLETAAADPRMGGWRLYYCDWGFSTFDEKLRAVISDRVKIIPTMCRMADLLLMPAYLPARLWALGSTTAPAEWLEEGRLSRWLRLSGVAQPVRRRHAGSAKQ